VARHGRQGTARGVEAWFGEPRQGGAWQARRGMARLGVARHGAADRGTAGKAWLNMV